MGCGCGKKRLPKVTKEQKQNPVSNSQTRMVYVHIWSVQHKDKCSFLTNQLNAINVKWEWKVDKPALNRGYPYLTINEEVVCIRRVTEAVRKGEL